MLIVGLLTSVMNEKLVLMIRISEWKDWREERVYVGVSAGGWWT